MTKTLKALLEKYDYLNYNAYKGLLNDIKELVKYKRQKNKDDKVKR